MIGQLENESISLSGLSAALVMIAQLENESNSLSVLSAALVHFPPVAEYCEAVSLVDCAQVWEDQRLGPQLKQWLKAG